MPAPLAMPATDQPSPACPATLWTVSVVLIATAASSWPSGESAPAAASTPASDRVHRQQLADQAGGADHDVPRRDAEDLGDVLGRAVGVEKALGAGAGVGAAGVEDDGVDPAVRDDLPRPRHRRGLDPVAS